MEGTLEEQRRVLGITPFEAIRKWEAAGELEAVLRDCRVGNYTKNTLALWAVAHDVIDLSRATPERLERYKGIGPKTSRFFILWTRPWERYAALDIHILRWLNSQGIRAPKTTPKGKRYYELEQEFLRLADEAGLTPRELDYKIWCEYAGRTQEDAGYEAATDLLG